jgi:type II secretory ATPase GspE/PulE/Tfp pilus assembly ATPase PilB-like protein
LGLVDARQEPLELVQGQGCGACFRSGYAGREVIAETLTMSPRLRELVLRRAPERDLQQAAVEGGMQSLREHGLAKAAAKITTLEEIFRTTTGETLDT